MKRSIAFLLGIALMLFCTGCDSASERLATESYKHQAAKNARAYILDKYGIDAYAVSAKEDRADDLFGTNPRSEIFVTMEYEDETFTVYIDGGDENTDGADNYQQEEILAAFQQALREYIPETPYALSLFSGSGEGTHYVSSDKVDASNLHSAYFDGTNLAEILAETTGYPYRCSCVAEYVGDVDLSGVSLTAFAEKYNTTIAALSYKDASCYDKVTEHTYNIRGSYAEEYFCQNAMYLNDALYADGYEDTHLEFDFGQTGEFYYMIPNQPADSVTIQSMEQPLDASGWNGRGILDAELASDSYEVVQGDGVLYLYFPKEDKGAARLGEVTDGAYEAVGSTKETKDYIVCWLYLRADRNQTKQFALIR